MWPLLSNGVRERIFLRRRQDSFGYRGLCLRQPRRWPGLLCLALAFPRHSQISTTFRSPQDPLLWPGKPRTATLLQKRGCWAMGLD